MVRICCVNSIEDHLVCYRKILSKPLFIGVLNIISPLRYQR